MFKTLLDYFKNIFKICNHKKYKFRPSSTNYVTFTSTRITVDLKRYFKTDHGKNALSNLSSFFKKRDKNK